MQTNKKFNIKTLLVLFLLLLNSCIHTSQKNEVIAFNKSQTPRLIEFINQLKQVQELDTIFEMQYFLKSKEIVFHYLDSTNKVGDRFVPQLKIPDKLKKFFVDVGFYILFRNVRNGCFDIHLSLFRNGRKEINIIIFDSTDTFKNNLYIKRIITDNNRLIFFDKKVYYYEDNWW
jgi:hypothetical protein